MITAISSLLLSEVDFFPSKTAKDVVFVSVFHLILWCRQRKKTGQDTGETDGVPVIVIGIEELLCLWFDGSSSISIYPKMNVNEICIASPGVLIRQPRNMFPQGYPVVFISVNDGDDESSKIARIYPMSAISAENDNCHVKTRRSEWWITYMYTLSRLTFIVETFLSYHYQCINERIWIWIMSECSLHFILFFI